MGKTRRGLRDGTGPYSGGVGRRKIAGAICPFDEESIEDLKDMDFEFDIKRKAKVVSDEIGKGRFLK